MTNSRARTTSSSSTNWTSGSKPAMQGSSRRRRSWLIGVTMSVPSTLANRSTVTARWGLSSAKSRTSDSTSMSERSSLVRTGPVRVSSSRNHVGSCLGGAVDVGGGLDDHLAHRGPAGAGRGQQVEGADDVDLVEDPARHGHRVGLEEGVHDGVHLGGPHDPAEDGVLLVGADELGALQRHPGLVGPQAQDHLDVGLGLEGLGHAAAPEGVQPGDQDAPAHGSAEPDAAPLAQHVVEGVLHAWPGCARPRP